MFLTEGVAFDREGANVPRNDNGDAVFSFGVAASDGGIPVQDAITTVSARIQIFIADLRIIFCLSNS